MNPVLYQFFHQSQQSHQFSLFNLHSNQSKSYDDFSPFTNPSTFGDFINLSLSNHLILQPTLELQIMFVTITVILATFILIQFIHFISKKYRGPDATGLAYDDRIESERKFINLPSSLKTPSLYNLPTITLSVVVPAYNEELRLPTMIEECVNFLEMKKKQIENFIYEIIIVSDGSNDNTVSVGKSMSIKYGGTDIRVINLVKNRGKGGAVRAGFLSSRGKYILFADADGATKFSEYDKLEKRINDKLTENNNDIAIICGSRSHLEEESIAQRSMFRTFLMKGFHFLLRTIAVDCIRDTQCGFKLFTRKAAILTFSNMHITRWAFDVDILFIGTKLNVEIDEICVDWHEVDGSKIVPVWSWLEMARDIVFIRLMYLLNIWKIDESHRLRSE
ncbi:hypothetical protein SNEBB_009455 [Seison nebaliae]|nr:hypothetical protein SNEBB_009455 [Seison nebaliae]